MNRIEAGRYEVVYKEKVITIWRQGRTWCAQVPSGLIVDRCTSRAEALKAAQWAFDQDEKADQRYRGGK